MGPTQSTSKLSKASCESYAEDNTASTYSVDWRRTSRTRSPEPTNISGLQRWNSVNHHNQNNIGKYRGQTRNVSEGNQKYEASVVETQEEETLQNNQTTTEVETKYFKRPPRSSVLFTAKPEPSKMRARSCEATMKHPTPDYTDRVGGKLYSSTLKTLANEQRNGRLLGGIIKKCIGWDKKTVYRVNCEKEHDTHGNYRYKREADFFGMGKLKALVKKKIEDEREKIRAKERRNEQRDAAIALLLEEIVRLRQEIEASRASPDEEWQDNIIL
ncbi:unnamed protein product, partial [Mesorhabditis spiculigera]